ncbi:MAG: ABC transporter ATP-binding protein [Candidatus Thorarchaeota archaeon]
MHSAAKTAPGRLDDLDYAEPKLAAIRRYRSGKHIFFSFFWKNPPLILFSLVMNVFAALFALAPAILTGIAIDTLESKGFHDEFLVICLLLIIAGILYFVTSFLANYSFGITAFAYERDIRQEYFDVIQSHSMTFHNEFNSSRLLSMGMTEISQMRHGLHPSMRILTQSFFSMALTVVFLTQIQLNFGLIVIVGIPVYFLFAYRYSAKIAPIRNQLANEIGSLTESCQEIFRGIEVVRGAGLAADQREKQNFGQKSRNFQKLAEREGKLTAFFLPALILIVMTVLVLALGLYELSNDSITTGELVEAIGLLLALQFLNFMAPFALLNIQASLVNANRIWGMLNWDDPQPDYAVQIPPDIDWNNDITFEDVNFSYNAGSKTALQNINVTIPKGASVALIGGPGSGKSTFLKLLLRLYDPQKGRILIGKQAFDAIPSEEVRNHVTMVEQETFLFSASIRENIAFSQPDASEEEIIAAAKAAQAHRFVTSMPEKYDSIIGERGVTLSGGQRQRLAIARALLADPEILLLDDVVSAVDSRTELLLQRALDRLLEGRTSITVTQRLSTLVKADLVIVLERGEILAHGTHEQLLASCPEYRRIFELLPKSEQILPGGAY